MAVLFYKWCILSCSVIAFLFSSVGSPAEEAGSTHPFYISITEINHNATEKTLEISCKIFADDMEAILKQTYKAPVNLTSAKEKVQNEKLIQNYITSHLQLAADGKGTKLTYVGFEKEAESVYCYFETGNVASLKKIDITNNILQDFNDKQINIIHVTVNNKRQSTKLDFPDKQASFTF